MRNVIRLALIANAVLSLTITGCATVQPGSPEAIYREQQEQKQQQKKHASESVAEAPSWFTELPPDGIVIYAATTNYSTEMQLAIDKAIQDAKGQLADKVQGVISGKTKQFIAESGMSENVQVVSDLQKISINLFTNVDLAGYSIQKQKVIPQGTGFRSYVLMIYPLGQANRILLEKIKANAILNSKLAATEAYAELEREIQVAKSVAP
jgi:hypothetical protein